MFKINKFHCSHFCFFFTRFRKWKYFTLKLLHFSGRILIFRCTNRHQPDLLKTVNHLQRFTVIVHSNRTKLYRHMNMMTLECIQFAKKTLSSHWQQSVIQPAAIYLLLINSSCHTNWMTFLAFLNTFKQQHYARYKLKTHCMELLFKFNSRLFASLMI